MQRNEITSHHAPVFGHRRNATVRGRRLRYCFFSLGPDLPLLALLRVPANAPGGWSFEATYFDFTAHHIKECALTPLVLGCKCERRRVCHSSSLILVRFMTLHHIISPD